MAEKHFWINQTFRKHPYHFTGQALIIALYIGLVLLVLMVIHAHPIDVLSAIGATSLASSAFLTFTAPQSPSARAYRVFGSYICANIAGVVGHYLVIFLSSAIVISVPVVQCLGASVAAALTMLAMLMLDLAHPPAMGVSIGLVVDYWDDRTLITVLVAVLVLCLIKKVLHRHLISLI